jgi:hypothetical protein
MALFLSGDCARQLPAALREQMARIALVDNDLGLEFYVSNLELMAEAAKILWIVEIIGPH